MNKHIALFGGSFDPIHIGHMKIAMQAQKKLELDSVDFILAKQSPFKEAPVSATDRFELLKKAIASYQEISTRDYNFQAIDIELNRPSPSYSYQTVQHYKESNPDSELFWIMGDDAFASLDKWKEAEYLIDNLQFIVFRREDNLNSDKFSGLLKKAANKAYFLENPLYEVSSTEIRKIISQELSLDLLNEKIVNGTKELVIQLYK